MEKNKKMVVCATCAAEFDAALVRCPYCGTAYAPAEEDEYISQLEDVIKDLEGQKEYGNRSPGKGSGGVSDRSGDHFAGGYHRLICESCKREIGPEELKCPYCGADNPFALQHAQNMEQFGVRYEDTRNEVIRSAKKTGVLAKKAAILAVLIIGIIITNLISSYNYADHDPEEAVRRDAEKNAAAYAEEARSSCPAHSRARSDEWFSSTADDHR